MSGLSQNNGQLLTPDAHLAQSISDILSTPVGSRLMRRTYGSDLPRLIDAPTLHKGHGRLTMHQNKYFSDWMNEFAGTKIVARFDPEDLHAGVHIYELDGSFMGFAACEEKVGFFNLTGAKDRARKTSAIKRTERKLLAQHRSLKPKDIAAELDAIPSADPVTPEAKVVQAEFGKKSGNAPLVQRPEYQDKIAPKDAAEQVVFEADFKVKKAEAEAAPEPEDARERYLRAVAIVAGADGAAGLANVVDDITPQLGGNLDPNGKKIAGILLPDGNNTRDFGAAAANWNKGFFAALQIGGTDLTVVAAPAADSFMMYRLSTTTELWATLGTGLQFVGATLDAKFKSDATGITGATALSNIVTLTQAQYDALGATNAATFYAIVG